jgi:AraC-like DNA-binding protein
MNTDYNKYSLQSDKIFFSPPGCYHELCSDNKGPMRTIEVKFIVKNKDMYDDLKNISGCINVDNQEIRHTLENLVREAVSKDTLSRDVINMEIFLILVKILRHLNDNKTEGIVFLDTSITNYSGTSKIFTSMFDYINNNLNISISLEDLAKRVGHDSTYLCRIFKKEFGVTPIKYINDLKLKKAKELLENSSMNVTEVSEALGFYSVHYFSKFFKEKENITPLEFRKNVRNNVNVKLDEKFDNNTVAAHVLTSTLH